MSFCFTTYGLHRLDTQNEINNIDLKDYFRNIVYDNQRLNRNIRTMHSHF
jgi:hypothetical protein